jgi:hypothetical protein
MQQRAPDPQNGEKNDGSASAEEKSLVKIKNSEKNVSAVGTQEEKTNPETNAEDEFTDEKDLESEKQGSLLDAGPDKPSSDASVEASVPGNDDWEYITGWKLLVVIVTICMAAFIIWLDTSIVATVSHLL